MVEAGSSRSMRLKAASNVAGRSYAAERSAGIRRRCILDSALRHPGYAGSLVVFTGDGVFKTERPPGVVQLTELEAAIRWRNQPIMDENRLQFCIGRIEFYRFYISGVTDAEHQAYLNRKYGDPLAGVEQG